MKTYKHLWEQLITKENFELAYQNSIRGKGWQRQIQIFQKNKEENLEAVRQLVINEQFHTSEYKEQTIYEPKERIIYKLPYCPDRIVQHAVMNVLKPIMLNLFIENTYACIKNRGQIKASLKCSEYVRKYRYCLKGDIKKFYPSINQHILSNMLHRIIKDDKFMRLVDDIIFSYPGGYNCPIGNYCSQWFGNFYLTVLDNYVLHELKPDGYERFCDDFLLFSNDKEFLQYCKRKIEVFILDKLDLEYSKAEVFDVKQGVDFCGYRSFDGYVLIRKSTSKRLKKRFKYIDEHIDDEDFDLTHAKGQVDSGNGTMKHACSYNLRKSIKYHEIVDKIDEKRKEQQS